MQYPGNTTTLTMNYLFSLSGKRDTVREAINWCFDNLTSHWQLESTSDLYGKDGVGDWAEFEIVITEDRDAVLFKTFWNDR